MAEQYAALRELPLAERQALLLETAWQELWNLINVGDRRALLFVVYQANRARHPVRQLVKLVTESLDKARQPYERRDTPAAAGSSPETMQGYGQHPLGPAQDAVKRLVDFLPAQAGEAILIRAEAGEPDAEAPAQEADNPIPSAAEAPVEEAVDAEPLSRIAALSRDSPALAEWLLERYEQRLVGLASHDQKPDRPPRTTGRKSLGP